MSKAVQISFLLLLLAALTARAQDPDPKSWLEPQHGQLRWLDNIGLLPAKGYVVQLAVYTSRAALERYARGEKLAEVKTMAVPIERDGQIYYYLLYGPYRFQDNANALARELERDRGIETWVRRIETIAPVASSGRAYP
jgi:septal ring-binding cell division protein DamX